MNPKNCCAEDSCIKKEIENMIEPDSPIDQRIAVAACAVAATCGKLTPEELRVCASRLFETTHECQITRDFIIAYQLERDAREGKRAIATRAGAGRLFGQGE